jgi:16S rRNA (adenine1518-N6/adenine1519-N6)-dimethyltransferase
MSSRQPYKKTDQTESDPLRFVHKKSLGQNFLTSDVVPRLLVEAGQVTKGDTILEIGPGTGALTRNLLATGATVIAVEADQRAIAVLDAEFRPALATRQLQLHHQDARYLDLPALGLTDHGFSVVANIPYYLSGFLLRTLLEGAIQPQTLVFLMQKEVVERIARDPKESLLSLSVKVFGDPKYVKTIKRGHFNPPPKVDSAILQVTNISRHHFTNPDEMAMFFNLLHLGFGQKRKQLLSNLSHVYDRSRLEETFANLSLPLDVRAEVVPLQSWIALAGELRTYPQSSPQIFT